MKWLKSGERYGVSLDVNGRRYVRWVEPRMLLSDFLRDELGLTGTHVGCEHGVCGACTVLIDAEPVRSCLNLAVEVEGRQITTIEGLAQEPNFPRIKKAFSENHALQCGFCTAGIIISVSASLKGSTEAAVDWEDVLSGHLCRCTGYAGLRRAVQSLAEEDGG